MEVDLALVADAANVSQEGKLNILGIFDTIWAREFPFRHSAMVFVLRVTAGFTDAGTHQLQVRLMGADGEQLFKAEGPLKVPHGAPGRSVRPHVIMGLGGVSFPKPGDYSFEVIVDEEPLKSVPLHVMPAPTAQSGDKLA
ncbi:MAG: hypothetical protein JSU87_17690 [Gemmatimonadota bacterium]|nr:MAG: hypothetical protein JSU87_17690 [Gemmatimonadota bacterium]